MRALEPSSSPGWIVEQVQELIARIPAADPDHLKTLADEITNLDLSVLTDPLAFLRQKVQQAVTEIRDAEKTVSDKLTGLLQPAADALDAATAAIHINDIKAALASLPAMIQRFVDEQIKPKVKVVQDAIHSAIQTVQTAVAGFNPAELLGKIKGAIEHVTALLQADEVKSAFESVQHALDTAIQAIEGFKLTSAADEAISKLHSVEDKLRSIDPSSIPSAAKPLLRQAVQVVTNIDFTHQVADPLLKEVEKAIETGPALLLNSLQQLMDLLKAQIERFRPSVVIGAQLDQPFNELMATLNTFQPSQLLAKLSDALKSVAGSIHLVDPDVLLGPLNDVYKKLHDGVELVKPSNLLKPVNDEIAAAIQRVIAATHFDSVFDGVDGILHEINDFVDLFSSASGMLQKLSALLTNPGEIDAALDVVVEATVAKLDGVAFARLQASFEETAAAVHSIERDGLAAEVANVLAACATHVPPALGAAAATRIKELARGFPLLQLRGTRATPSRRRLIEQLERLVAVADTLDRARTPWVELAPRLGALAPEVTPQLATYARITRLEGGSLFGDFVTVPASVAALKDAVRTSLHDGLRLPVTLLFGLYKAVAPHLGGLARGLSLVVAAVHTKLDAVTGEAGLGGVVHSIEDVVDLLRHLDLKPVTDPLDALFKRIEDAVAVLDPAPLGAALHGAADAIAGLLSLSTLVNDADIASLDGIYKTLVDDIAKLSPSALIGETLDPVFDEALGAVKPFLDLPGKLQGMIHEAGGTLEAEVIAELRRVELAFDQMLRAIPLGDDASGASASGSASLSVSA